MLRGIRKASSNWLGKIVMATVMGVLIVSFAVWGIADIFKGFGQSSLATVGRPRFRPSSSARSTRISCSSSAAVRPAADLGTGARLRTRPPGAAADHRRSRPGRGSAAHGACPVPGRNHAADLQRSQFQGYWAAHSIPLASRPRSGSSATPNSAISPSSAASGCGVKSPAPSPPGSSRRRC